MAAQAAIHELGTVAERKLVDAGIRRHDDGVKLCMWFRTLKKGI